MLSKFLKGLRNPSKIPPFISRTILTNFYRFSGQPVTSREVRVPIESEINRRYISSYVDGTYEKLEVDACYEYMCKTDNVIELGSGTGYVSSHIADIVNKNNKHIAVEANPKLVQLINNIKRLNKIEFVVVNKAYTSSDSSIEFYPHERPVSGATTPQNHREYSQPLEVDGISIQSIQQQYNIENFVLVSDIEGAEHEFIRNELDILKENCRLLIIELHPEKSVNDGTVEDAINRLESFSFELIDKPNPDRGFYIFENLSLP